MRPYATITPLKKCMKKKKIHQRAHRRPSVVACATLGGRHVLYVEQQTDAIQTRAPPKTSHGDDEDANGNGTTLAWIAAYATRGASSPPQKTAEEQTFPTTKKKVLTQFSLVFCDL